MTSGFVPGDLKKLCRLAALQALNNLDNGSKRISDSDDMDNLVEDLIRLKINENNDEIKVIICYAFIFLYFIA